MYRPKTDRAGYPLFFASQKKGGRKKRGPYCPALLVGILASLKGQPNYRPSVANFTSTHHIYNPQNSRTR